jgi:DNA-binding transcriptional ArsR family regulator
MPFLDTNLSPPRTLVVSVRPSIAIEIEWALGSAERDDYLRDHPVLAEIYTRHPELRSRVRSFWGPGEAVSCGGFMELMVIAHHGAMLFTTDAGALLEALPRLIATTEPDPDDLPLLAETPEDRRAILYRLARLRESPELRARYVDLVRDMWEAIGADWERSGRSAVEVAVAARSELVAKGADWHEVARSEHGFGDVVDEAVAALPSGGELVVVPAFFTHFGLVFDLPGVVVVGVRTDTTGVQARARTEALARRLKAISDPTRLAILDALRSGPRTVTELATAFSLAQPTVSNHVKILREAGLVADQREGTRRNLVVRPEAVEELLASLRDVVSERMPT